MCEIEKMAQMLMDELDKDKSGFVEAKEIIAFMQSDSRPSEFGEEQAKAVIAQLDSNKDGKLDFSEVKNLVQVLMK